MVTIVEGRVIDITSSDAPTVRDVCEQANPADYVRFVKDRGNDIGDVESIRANSWDANRDPLSPWFLAPTDLQALKASGVTFVVSLLERVIEEQARGTPEKAAAIRADGRLEEFVKNRYRSWDSGIGKKIESGKASFKSLETYILKKGEVSKNESGRQEFLENLINEFI